jgi:hypothetical protein
MMSRMVPSMWFPFKNVFQATLALGERFLARAAT